MPEDIKKMSLSELEKALRESTDVEEWMKLWKAWEDKKYPLQVRN